MIKISHLTKQYPLSKEATLKDINITLNDVGLYYLIGKSGAGKSTFLSLLGGMDFDYLGSIKVNEKELKEMTEEERATYRFETIAFAFQDYKAEESETVKENLLKGLAITSLSKEEKMERITYYVRKLGLEDKLGSTFITLSGGEKKRISFIRALLKETPILLLDEPLASLHPKLREAVSLLLLEESKRRLVLLITHEREEILKDATVLEIENGQLFVRKENTFKKVKPLHAHYQRKKYKGASFYLDLFRALIRKKEFLFVTLFSLAISLFTVSFSFLLSHGVSKSLSSSLENYMKENTMVITQREEGSESLVSLPADSLFLNYMTSQYEEDVIGPSTFYLESLDNIFGRNQTISLVYNNKSLTLEKLSLSSFLAFKHPEERETGSTYYGLSLEKMSQDDVLLSLSEDGLLALYYLLYGMKPNRMDEEVIKNMATKIILSKLAIRIQASKSEWHYQLDHALTVTGLLTSGENEIYSPYLDFNTHFVEDVLYFDDAFEHQEKENPYTLTKAIGLRLYPNKAGSFLSHFFHEKEADPYRLKPFRKQEEVLTQVLIYKDNRSKLSIAKIESFISDHPSLFGNVRYSTPIFTYTASGYISGFNKPFFFSRYKEKLNAIVDNHHTSSINLNQFQASLIPLEDGVLKADLLSSSQEDGLLFTALDRYPIAPLYGKKPTDYASIAISEGLANKLFTSPSQALNKNLEVLTLVKTIEKKDHYENVFEEGSLEIVGIYPGEESILFQDSLFPLGYFFENIEMDENDLRINSAVLDVDLKNKTADYYLNDLKRYPSLRGSFPMLSILDEMEKTMLQLANLFLAFACLSLLLSMALFSLSLYLILLRDKKSIGILLSLGYQKKEIARFYQTFLFLLGLLSYLFSLFLTLLSERILAKTLEDLLSIYQMNLFPYLLSFSIMLFFVLLLSLFLGKKLEKVSPKDAFLG